MTPNAYVHLESDTLRIEVDREKKMQVPLHHIGSVVCFGDVMMTPGAMHRCAADGRSVVLLDRNGRFKARLEGSVSGNILFDNCSCVALPPASLPSYVRRSFARWTMSASRSTPPKP